MQRGHHAQDYTDQSTPLQPPGDPVLRRSSALASAPGYGADAGTNSATPVGSADSGTVGNAVYQPKTQPLGNAQYQPTDQPTGNAVYQPSKPATTAATTAAGTTSLDSVNPLANPIKLDLRSTGPGAGGNKSPASQFGPDGPTGLNNPTAGVPPTGATNPTPTAPTTTPPTGTGPQPAKASDSKLPDDDSSPGFLAAAAAKASFRVIEATWGSKYKGSKIDHCADVADRVTDLLMHRGRFMVKTGPLHSDPWPYHFKFLYLRYQVLDVISTVILHEDHEATLHNLIKRSLIRPPHMDDIPAEL